MSYKVIISICMGSSCYARGNRELVDLIKNYLVKEKLNNDVQLKGALCCDLCGRGPIVLVDGEQVLINSGDPFLSVISIVREKLL
ncbi:MAG: (2Fe-2S) ferredoxin domain-containing protein [Bacteriovoracaceae bacterium]|nr:(2Fe-2S) ferredoxin domain-containing protein [Bacteriovoracaceae bacterium]